MNFKDYLEQTNSEKQRCANCEHLKGKRCIELYHHVWSAEGVLKGTPVILKPKEFFCAAWKQETDRIPRTELE